MSEQLQLECAAVVEQDLEPQDVVNVARMTNMIAVMTKVFPSLSFAQIYTLLRETHVLINIDGTWVIYKLPD